jgi:DNA-directed RNA polymerase specialized sigma24 family protein
VIIQQKRNEAVTASDDQLMGAVVKRPVVNPWNCGTAILTNQVEAFDLSELLKCVLHELPEGQKDVINFASKGMSWREIAAKGKISVGEGKTRHHLA